MSRRLEKLIEQKAWETLTDYGYNDAHLLEQLTDATIEKLTEQVGAPILPSWLGIVQFIQVQIAQGNAGQGQDSYATSTYDYDGDGQITFTDLTIALSLWARGIMPVSAQDYQAGALIIDDSGFGEPITPEGEELLNILTSGQQTKGPVGGKTDPMLKFSRPLRGVRPILRPNQNVSRTGPQLSMGGPARPGRGA